MVEVGYEPVKKIIVHEAIKHDLPDYLRMKAVIGPQGQPPPPVKWCDGVLFEFSAMPNTPELINERVKDGIIHWAFIEFAEMQKYQNIVTHPDTQAQMRVVDASNNSAIADVIRHFKNDNTFFPSTGT